MGRRPGAARAGRAAHSASRSALTRPPPRDWSGLLQVSLLERLRELLDLLEDCRRLDDHVRRGGPFPAALAFHRTRGPRRCAHRDHGRALWSGGSAALAVVLVCAFWIATGWADGAVAAEMAAVACCFFAALDDPVPAIVQFLTWSVVAVVVDAVLLFAVLPAADGFPMLVAGAGPALPRVRHTHRHAANQRRSAWR